MSSSLKGGGGDRSLGPSRRFLRNFNSVLRFMISLVSSVMITVLIVCSGYTRFRSYFLLIRPIISLARLVRLRFCLFGLCFWLVWPMIISMTSFGSLCRSLVTFFYKYIVRSFSSSFFPQALCASRPDQQAGPVDFQNLAGFESGCARISRTLQ